MTREVPSVETVTGTGVPVRGNDVDTDQVIPSRFLKALTFEGLGEFVFFDQRFDAATREGASDVDAIERVKDHPFNEDRFQDASILVVNDNFGCGSSREHAPQSLKRWGIDALVGESFAEIFAGNCLSLGIPTVTADEESVADLQDWIDDNPDGEIDVDVENETVTYGDRTIDVDVDEGKRTALVEGNWDTTALLRSNSEAVRETAASLPYVDDADLPDPENA